MTRTRSQRWIRPTLALICGVVVVALLGPLLTGLREPDDGKALPPDVPGRLIDVDGHQVHGFGASTHDFEPFVLEPLAETHHVIALDPYGFGWSERDPAFTYGWTLWADQPADTLDALGIGNATMVGHSIGGAFATVFTARYPERIDRLVLADSFYPLKPCWGLSP